MAESTHLERAKADFLETYGREHQTTLGVLSAYPEDQLDLRPHPKLKSALELAWMFVLERGLGTAVYNDAFADGVPQGTPDPPPRTMAEVIAALRRAHSEFAELVRSTPPQELDRKVHFLTGPGQLGQVSRIDWLWFLLHDEIHHRGQFSVYLRMAGGHVPSIYGPTADEPWL